MGFAHVAHGDVVQGIVPVSLQVKELEGQLTEARRALEATPPQQQQQQQQQQAPTAAGDDAAQQADASLAASDTVSLTAKLAAQQQQVQLVKNRCTADY
jgi:lipid A disaccharide synthetase